MTKSQFLLSALFGAMLTIASANALSAQNGPSPMLQFRNVVGDRDPVQFLLKRDKPLALTDTQKDSLKKLRKELDDEEKPMFKEVEKYFQAHPTDKKLAFTVTDVGSGNVILRGPVPASSARTTLPSVPASVPGPESRVPEPSPFPAAVQLIQAQIYSKQDLFRERARTYLTESQASVADSLAAAERARDSKQP